ncbi:peptidase C39 [Azospirillum sp. TSO22-1]|nr:peptidase C39 [Azospirillum sp. TSO22-1]
MATGRCEPDADPATDGGVTALAALLRLSGLAVDPAELQRMARSLGGFSGGSADASTLLTLARDLGFHARLRRVGRGKLPAAGLPALAELHDGGFVLVARADAARVLVLDPATNRPVERPRAEFDAGWTGRLLLAERPAASGAGPARFGLRWFLPALARHRWVLTQSLFASLFLQLFGLATPLFSMVVIDKVLASGSVGTLDVLVIGMAAMALFDTLTGVLRSVLLTHTTNRLDVELGARLFDHLTALPLSYFESRPVGALAARVKELESIRATLTGPGLTIGLDVLFTIVFVAVMWSFSPALTGIVLLTVAGFALVHGLVSPALKGRLVDRFARGADAQSFLVEAVHGIETLKAMAVEGRMRRRWQELLVANTRASFRAAVLSEATGQVVGFLNKIMAVAILWYGAHLVMDNAITAGTLIAVNMMAGRVSAPVLRLTQIWQQVQQARVAMQKVGDVLNAQPEPGAVPGRTPLGRVEGRIAFRDVTFRYHPKAPAVLDGVSFEVAPGQVVGLVGVSGSGKSTVAKLLQRLHVPERGAVSVDGVDLAGIDPAWLRRQIGVVPQDVVLFNRSVRDNIALADPTMPMERVVEVARLAGAHDFIVGLPEAYDTPVGERGMRLSGGQRQRLALARALVGDPRILILDEATSSLDYESEAIIHRNMRRICAGRTVFVIAHRLAALREADRVLVLEHGRVVEDGPHADLVQAGGRYALLHAFQVGQGHAAAAIPVPAE